MANVAVSAATARSQLATNWQPPAVASAWTRATTGCGSAWMVFIMVVQTSNNSRDCSRVAPAMSAKLWPALKTGPLAARITPRASVRAMARRATVNSRITLRASALRLSARLRVTVVMGPSVVTSRCSYFMVSFCHPGRVI